MKQAVCLYGILKITFQKLFFVPLILTIIVRTTYISTDSLGSETIDAKFKVFSYSKALKTHSICGSVSVTLNMNGTTVLKNSALNVNSKTVMCPLATDECGKGDQTPRNLSIAYESTFHKM